jgi:hypothetical protein
VGLAVGSAWLVSGAFQQPPTTPHLGTAADGHRAQQKLFEIATGGAMSKRRDGRSADVTLSEPELNAFLTRHVSADQLPLGGTSIRLVGDGVVEVAGRLPLRAFTGDLLGGVLDQLPDRWRPGAMWLRVRGPIRLQAGAARGDRRELRLDVERLWLGRRRLPTVVLSAMPGGTALQTARWPMLDAVESLTVDPGRVTIATRP